MELTKIRMIGKSTIDLPIIDAELTDEFIVTNVDGLGPPEVDVSITSVLDADGYYQGRRPQNREIVLTVRLNPDYYLGSTVGSLRTTLYGLLTPGLQDMIEIDFMNQDTILAIAEGYVKKIEIVPFSQQQAVQITVACNSPFLKSKNLYYLDLSETATFLIDNIGTAASGFSMTLTFTQNTTNLVLTDSESNVFSLAYSFLTNDVLLIDTRAGSRKIILTRGGVPNNLIYALSADSKWPLLFSGQNQYSISTTNFVWGDVYYHPQYWGI